MRRDTMKLLIFAGVIGFAVLYGMELSSKGIKDVNGTLETGNELVGQDVLGSEEWSIPTQVPVTKKPTQQTQQTQQSQVEDNTLDSIYSDWDPELYGIPQNDRKPIVDRVSGAAGDVLHDLSRNGIRFVVSFFDRVTG